MPARNQAAFIINITHLLLHWLVAVGARAVEHDLQRAGRGVIRLQREAVGAAFHHGCHEGGAHGLVLLVHAVVARPEAVLQVGHDPRAGAGAAAPHVAVAEVDGLQSR